MAHRAFLNVWIRIHYLSRNQLGYGMSKERVVLAMSGGVDSSVAAVLLQQQGYEVIGLFMRSGEASASACSLPPSGLLPVIERKSHKQGCCSAADAADAQRVADLLDIPFHALNFRDSFDQIKSYFADEYLKGRTPNPCVMCNVWLKFGRLWEFAQQVGATRIATGHYARIIQDEFGQTRLMRGADLSKDQSYVLFGIRPEILSKILFPVGHQTKAEIREIAAQANLRVAGKPDSQEICFIPDNDYRGFLRRYRDVSDTSGNFVDPQGKILGQHSGFEQFTIGQRRGLGIALGEPRFVIRIDAESRNVTLGTAEELGSYSLVAARTNWLSAPTSEVFSCTAQIRSMHRAAAAYAQVDADGTLHLRFCEPQSGVAPGQAVVLYDSLERVICGAWIEDSHSPRAEALALVDSHAC